MSPAQEECFWLCVDTGKQYSLHVLQGTGRDCAQLRRGGVLWVSERDIADAGFAEYSPGWVWKFKAHVWMDATAGIAVGSRRGLGRVKHIDTVFFWV